MGMKIKDVFTFEEFDDLMWHWEKALDWQDRLEAWGVYVEDGTGAVYHYEAIITQFFQKLLSESSMDYIWWLLHQRDSVSCEEYERMQREVYEEH